CYCTSSQSSQFRTALHSRRRNANTYNEESHEHEGANENIPDTVLRQNHITALNAASQLSSAETLRPLGYQEANNQTEQPEHRTKDLNDKDFDEPAARKNVSPAQR